MQFLKEKIFKQTIPPVKIKEGEETTHETATAAMKTVHFISALQSSHGHWPAENSGPLFYLLPLVKIRHSNFLDFMQQLTITKYIFFFFYRSRVCTLLVILILYSLWNIAKKLSVTYTIIRCENVQIMSSYVCLV